MVLFLLALVLVTAYAIGFRDFIRIPALMSLTQMLMQASEGWPPSWIWTPNFMYQYEDVEGVTRIMTMVYGMIAIALASAMQTLYFRGFLMARMARYGWFAPIFSTVLFATFHINSPAFWPMFFVFTLGWGIVTYLTRNVWISVISHMLFNTYSIMLTFFSIANF